MDSGKAAHGVEALIWSWHDAKTFLEHTIAFSPDALHTGSSVLLLLAAALVLRKPISSWWPWFVVLLLAVLNEVVDLWVERWPYVGMQYGEGAKDLLLTMFVPTVLVLSTRLLPDLFQPCSSRKLHYHK